MEKFFLASNIFHNSIEKLIFIQSRQEESDIPGFEPIELVIFSHGYNRPAQPFHCHMESMTLAVSRRYCRICACHTDNRSPAVDKSKSCVPLGFSIRAIRSVRVWQGVTVKASQAFERSTEKSHA